VKYFDVWCLFIEGCGEEYLKGHSEECGILEAPIISREGRTHARLRMEWNDGLVLDVGPALTLS
jgi:hypothetical protein